LRAYFLVLKDQVKTMQFFIAALLKNKGHVGT
jgi:hypothetical protein